MRFTILALLGVAAMASAATVETRDTVEARDTTEARDTVDTVEARDIFPLCVQRCQGNHFGCHPFDYNCLCRNNKWQRSFQKCCKDKCGRDSYRKAGKTVSNRCRKTNHPFGW